MSEFKDAVIDQLQYTIDNILVRNRSIVDQLTKFQDCCSKLSRVVAKSATTCGCIQINVSKQPYPPLDTELSIDDLSTLMRTHIEGQLCNECLYLIDKEIGRTLFYLSAICNTFDISLYDCFIQELKRAELLGKYSLR